MRLPRPAPLEVIIKPPIHPHGGNDAAAELRLTARASILEDLVEPDLAGTGPGPGT